MVLSPFLLIGTTTYFILQVLIHHFSSKDMTVTTYGYTNTISTYIWCYGIMLFLKRCKCNSIQKIENPFVRFLLQISFVLITLELLLGVWGCIETLVLIWMPDAANYVVKEFFGIGSHKVWEWPFVILLWVISSYCAHYANNADRLIAYYLNDQDNDNDIADSQSDVGDAVISEEELTVMNPRHRSKYTHTVSTFNNEPSDHQRLCSRSPRQ